MRRELLGSLAAAASTPWAIRREMLDEARATLATGGLDAFSRFAAMPLGAEITEPVRFVSSADARVPDAPAAAIHPATERAISRKAGSVAVIPVRGTISNRVTVMDWLFGMTVTPPMWIARQVRAAVNDDAVKAVIMDHDSPGGSVIQVPEAADAIFKMRGRKPIISQVSGTCASADYWIAASADEIVATPSAMVGSVGVYMLTEDWSKFWEEVGVKHTFVATNPEKVEGNEYEPLSPEAEAHLREMVTDYMDMFVAALARGRGQPESVIRGERFGRGRTYVAGRALERGMVDKVRTLTETLETYGVVPDEPEPETRRGRTRALMTRELEALERGGD